MAQPSRLSINPEGRIVAHYRNEGDAHALTNRLQADARIVNLGSMHAVAFVPPASHNAEQLMNTLQLDGPTRNAVAAPLTQAVIAAHTQAATQGLQHEIIHHAHAHSGPATTGHAPAEQTLQR